MPTLTTRRCVLSQTIEDCTALANNDPTALGFAGAGNVFNCHGAKLVNCSILRCHANYVGGLDVQRALLEMVGGIVAACSSSTEAGGFAVSGEARLVLVHVLVSECQSRLPNPIQKGGGGIYVRGNGIVQMSGGAIRGCQALTAYGGGLRCEGTSLVQLRSVTVQGCAARKGGAISTSAEGSDVSLIDVNIEDCVSSAEVVNSRSRLHAERVRVVRFGPGRAAMLVSGSSTWSNCTFSDGTWADHPVAFGGAIDVYGGRHTFTRTAVLRSKGLYAGGLVLYSGFAIMLDSRIADCSGTQSGCIRAEGGVLILRNSMLSNCSASKIAAHPYISFTKPEAATTFESELLALEPSCEADPSIALIGIINEAVNVTLKVRGLRVLSPAACASSTNLSVFSDHVRPLDCSDGNDVVCGAAASCTDVQPLPASPALTTVNCSCQGEFFPNPKATSLALAPYGFDPTTIGLPGPPIDYCVRCGTWLEPTCTAAFCFY